MGTAAFSAMLVYIVGGGVVLLLGVLYMMHTTLIKNAAYEYVVENGVFNNEGEEYLNMGLWTDVDLEKLHGKPKEIMDSLQSEMDSNKPNLQLTYRQAQIKMYQIFFALGNLRQTGAKVLETGGGPCSHYVKFNEWGLKADMTVYEKFLARSKQLDALPEDFQNRFHHMQRGAETVSDDPTSQDLDTVIAVETAFHYPDRHDFFKRSFKAL